jgi:hypothetical protein
MGENVHVLAYTKDIKGEKEFKRAALTRKLEIINSVNFDKDKTYVFVIGVRSYDNMKKKVELSQDLAKKAGYGDVVDYSMFSHAGVMDGPIFTKNKQVNMQKWSEVGFNWEKGGYAKFYGCNTGRKPSKQIDSFSQRFANVQKIKTFGQVASAVFSKTKDDYKRIDPSKGPVHMISVGGPIKRGFARIFKTKPYPLKEFTPQSKGKEGDSN